VAATATETGAFWTPPAESEAEKEKKGEGGDPPTPAR